MKVYVYDKVTKEYIGTVEAYIDSVASRRVGHDVYLMPSYTTELVPPEANHGEVAIFQNKEWKVVPDFRGQTVYNYNTRESVVWNEIGPLPKGFTSKAIERLEDVKDNYIQIMKNNLGRCLYDTKINIPSTELYFNYGSVERLKREQSTGILMSRDDNNKIYMLTRQEYDVIINYLIVFGQYLYIQKWLVENNIKKCENVEILKTYKDKLDFRVDQKQINNLVKMTPGERKAYFVRMVEKIK